MVTDENGYLAVQSNLSMTTGQQADGVDRTLFRREVLCSALTSFGEDDCTDVVLAGLAAKQVYDIGVVCHRLIYTADPDKSSGAGYAFERHLRSQRWRSSKVHPDA